LCLALASAPASASDDCDAPTQRWQPRDAVLQYAASQGWQVQRLKIDDGCYEIRGRDAQGRSFKAKLDPETLRTVKIKRRDHDREHRRERHSEGRDGTPAPDAASAPHPILTPGTTPRGQIE
jgi:hypothetical protein